MLTQLSMKWVPPRWAYLFLPILLAAIPPAEAQTGLTGDVNLDGAINVLDVQSTINMALGAAENAGEADIDENLAVDVLDIQALTNTVLGVGGLVQRVIGTLNLQGDPSPAGVTVVALSQDGRMYEAAPAEDGSFELNLPVRTSWGFGFLTAGDSPSSLGALSFPVGNGFSTVLPIENLSSGGVLDLGTLSTAGGVVNAPDIRTLLAHLAEPMSGVDTDSNGIPDFIDSLLSPLLGASLPLLGTIPDDLLSAQLGQWLEPCLQPALNQVLTPDISGMEIAGIPALLQPVWSCIESSLASWIRSSGLPIPQEIVQNYVRMLMDLLTPGIPEWLASLDRPELQDQDGDFVPDYLQAGLCPGQMNAPNSEGLSPCLLDQDHNGILDFAEDADGDGIPNLFDADSRNQEDTDGDGIPNAVDIDDDGDGIPDYADND